MSSQILSSTVTLSYPLYACDFDPNDPNRLVVAGGGGAGRSGVGNKISVLDSPDSDHLALSSELELSRDEDNVTTLAVGQTKGNTTQVLAGVNSSPADLAKGKNEHFRVFSLDTPPATPKRTPSSPSTPTTVTSFTGSSRVSEVQRSPLFGSASKNVYQRLLRLPPPPTSGPSLIGAAAPSDAPDPEIALFETGPSSPTVRPRGRIELTREAMDLDVIQTADDTYQLAHCDEHELYLFNVAKMTGGKTPNIPFTEGPECVYTVPHDQSSGSPDPDSRPAFRSIRYLTTGFILAVANLPKSKGVVLQGLRLPSSAPLPEPQNEDDPPEQQPEENRKARLSVTRRLPKQITKATSLAVRNLSPPSSPGASAGNTQFVIAVADNSSTISLFTLDHTSLKLGSKPSTGPKAPAQVDLLSNLLPFATLSGVHPMQITGLSFSVSIPPPPPPTGSSKAVAKSAPVVKLASVSVGNTAIVHAIPLREVPDSKPSSKKERPADTPRQQRYIVAVPPKEDRPVGLGIVVALAVLVLAFLGQVLLESQGYTSTNIVGARTWFPQQWVREPLPRLRVGTDHGGFLGKLIRDIEGLGEGDVNKVHEEGGKIVLRTEGTPDATEEAEPVQDVELKVEVHDEDVHGDSARSWDELKTPEREAWKKKLKQSGHWVEDMGEAVFKGILFGEIGGLVGNVMAAGAGLR